MNRLARFWPFRRAADPALVREFRIKDRPEVHRVEAGTPLADARDRGAVVLFEADDLGRYVLGRADNDQGKPIAMICGWTSYSKGHVSDALGNVVEKRVAVAWGWKIEEAEAALDKAILNGDDAIPPEDRVGLLNTPASALPPAEVPSRAKRAPRKSKAPAP